ncbi:uncharacterized protein JN550_006381 [Neoarthrinium moseri]|uniref:uncharacterized protein n=1 Tax=Neoarthrinium moseri TaxID=1658444 RepID=UPI001FDCF2A3|nr:uncharacterized protein JN550_006381 [Neoarthrinium moseri]KAI1868465.1 hypothetical protein JN550_006381 [Neoarthrinium moseri]
MLCSVCVNFDVRGLLLKAAAQRPKGFNDPTAPQTLEALRPKMPYFFKHHPNLLALRASASDCDLCSCIWQSYVAKSHPSELSDEALSQGKSVHQIFIGTEGWDVTLHSLPHVIVHQDRDSHEDRSSKLIQMRSLASFEVCADRRSTECLQLAAQLLKSCTNTHGPCRAQYPLLSELPTRIIDIAGVNPALVDGGGHNDTYVALSYCWGGDGDFRLTGATEQSFRQGLPLSQFPPTFRDAIVATKALGFRYIWIDALCIIQDSPHDWEVEASRMREVYRGAVVTIAAACASRTGEGIFRGRPQAAYPRCWLEWRNGDQSTPKVFLRPGTELWDQKMRQSVLNTRGWVLQETLLAPRTLWFGHQQISFECPKGSVDEGGRSLRLVELYRSKESIQVLRTHVFPAWKRRLLPILRSLHLPLAIHFPWPSLTDIARARDLETLRHRAIPWRPLTLQGSFVHPAQPSVLSHFDFWVQIVGNYSSRELTKPTDVLPALSGLASEFHRATGDTYVAGLWKMDIIQGLSWIRHARIESPSGWLQPVPTLPEQYIAPSWSWASTLGKRVTFLSTSQFDHIERLAKVIDVDVQLATNDTFGAVKCGSIILQAPFLVLPCQDILEAPHPTSRYPKVLARLYTDLRGLSEYGQKHRGYPGQQFAVLQLLKCRPPLSTITIYASFLLLESVEGDNSWRRLACVRLKIRDKTIPETAVDDLAIWTEIKRDVKIHTVKIV